MGKFAGHEELHDIYPEINPAIETSVRHKVGKVKKRGATSVMTTSVAPAAGLLLAGAAVAVMGLTGIPTINLELGEVTRTEANVAALTDLGLSDAQYPLEYRLYRVAVTEAVDEAGIPAYDDIMQDPRPLEEKYEILETVETGEIAGPEERLSFEGLVPGTDYLLLLYPDADGEDMVDAYGTELHFRTLGGGGGGGGPGPAPAPEPEPEPEPAPEPEPEPEPEPVLFTVTFVDADGTELSAAEYEEGTESSAIAVPDTPTKAADANWTYTFAGWTPALAAVTADATYTATYTATAKPKPEPAPEPTRYTVSFLGRDGSVLSSADYEEGTPGEDVAVPDVPEVVRDGEFEYFFMGWDPEVIADVNGNATYKALYEREEPPVTYVVRFVDWDGTELSNGEYDEGTPASDLDVPPDPERPSDGAYEYAFAGWTPTIADVTANATYTASYTSTRIVTKYTVEFVDWDDRVISSMQYEEDTPASGVTVPPDPERAPDADYEYVFIGWDPEAIRDVTEDFTYRALYAEEPLYATYTITFVDWDGTVITEDDYREGTQAADIAQPDTPTRASDGYNTYTFTRWTPAIADVTADVTYTANYRSVPITYTVTFVDWDGTVLSSTQYNVGTPGEDVAEPPEPEREPDNDFYYFFESWDPDTIADVTEDATYTAQYYTEERPQYVVTFYDWNGEVLLEKSYAEGTTAATVEADAPTPTRPTAGGVEYTFTGWSPDVIQDVDDDMEYYAQYSEHLILTVSFVDGYMEGYQQYASATGTPNPGGGWLEGEIALTNNTFFDRLVAGATPSEGVGAITVTWAGTTLSIDPEDSDSCDVMIDGDYVSGMWFKNPGFLYGAQGWAPSATLAVTVYYLDDGRTRTATASMSVPLNTTPLPGFTINGATCSVMESTDETFSLRTYLTIDPTDLAISGSAGNFITDLANGYGGSVTATVFGGYSCTIVVDNATQYLDGTWAEVTFMLEAEGIPMSVYDATDPQEPVSITVSYSFPQSFDNGETASIYNSKTAGTTMTDELAFN